MLSADVIGKNFQKAFTNIQQEFEEAGRAFQRLWNQVPQPEHEKYTDVQRVVSAALKVFGAYYLLKCGSNALKTVLRPTNALNTLLKTALYFVTSHDLLVMGTNGFEKHVQKPEETATRAVVGGVVDAVKEKGFWGTIGAIGNSLTGNDSGLEEMASVAEESANRRHALTLVENTIAIGPIMRFVFSAIPKV